MLNFLFNRFWHFFYFFHGIVHWILSIYPYICRFSNFEIFSMGPGFPTFSGGGNHLFSGKPEPKNHVPLFLTPRPHRWSYVQYPPLHPRVYPTSAPFYLRTFRKHVCFGGCSSFLLTITAYSLTSKLPRNREVRRRICHRIIHFEKFKTPLMICAPTVAPQVTGEAPGILGTIP